MKTYTFESNIKQILHIIIHTFYNDTDIFLRELISNSCDAIHKLDDHNNCSINIIPNEKENTLSIIDTGIGMTKNDLIKHIGCIGTSGTKNYIESHTLLKDDILRGFFGLGFYSCFLIADRVELITKHQKKNSEILRWCSDGVEHYSITNLNTISISHGSIIHLHLKKNMEKYLDPFHLRDIIKQHCKFCFFDIKLYIDSKYHLINLDKYIWNKSIDDLNTTEIEDLYKYTTNDYKNPLYYKVFKYDNAYGILYIPSNIGKMKNKFTLYCKKIYIHSTILPSFVSFLRGFVDIPFLDLNVSREQYQKKNNIMVSEVCQNIIYTFFELLDSIYLDKQERKKLFHNISTIFKMSIYKEENYQEKLMSYLLFYTSKDNYITLDEYIEKNKTIFYISGECMEKIKHSPFLEIFKHLDIEVLYMIDVLDEYVLRYIDNYKNHFLVSIQSFNIDEYIDIEKTSPIEETFKNKLLNSLGKDIEDIIISNRLFTYPCCVCYVENKWNPNMERIMKAQVLLEDSYKKKHKKVLELNLNHKDIKKVIENPTIQNIKRIYYIGCFLSDITIDNIKEFYNIL